LLRAYYLRHSIAVFQYKEAVKEAKVKLDSSHLISALTQINLNNDIELDYIILVE